MKVAVTGATGHVGANLVRALVDKDISVRCLVHVNHRAIEGLNVEKIQSDVRDLDSLCSAFQGIDIVYHLAATISLSMADWSRVEEINVKGTSNVVEACRRAGVRRLVHFSSIHALDQEPFNIPVDESRPLVSSSRYPPYDRSKAAAERIVKQGIDNGLDAVIIYPTAVFGPFDFQPSFFGDALIGIASRRLPAYVTGGFDWVDVRDVVSGAMQAAAKAPKGARYLLSGHWVSMCDIAAMIADITGVANSRPVCPLWLAHAAAPVIQGISHLNHKRPLYTSVSLRALKSNRCISHDRATRELGYTPHPFRETLIDTLNWFESNGYLKLPERAKTGEKNE
jgi:dihydroflavonol-4-reductase